MSYMITAECINCSACEMECPVRAIWAGSSQYDIDPGICIECDGYFPIPRCTWACPVDACVPGRPEYIEKAAILAKRGAPPIILTASHPAGREMQPVG